MLSTLILFIGRMHDSLSVNLFISQFDLAVVHTSELATANHSLLIELSIPQFDLAIVPLSVLLKLSIARSILLVSLSVFVPMRILLLLLNRQIFYTLSNVFEHICDYLKGEKRILLYINIIKQASNIFHLGLAFATGLIKTVKKDKSWPIEKCSKHKNKEFLAPLFCHVKADRIGKT